MTGVQNTPQPSPVEQLIQVVQRFGQAASVEDVIQLVKTAARQITKADGCCFVLREGDLCYYAAEDAIGPLWQGQRFPLNSCVSGWVMAHRQAAVISDVFLDQRVPGDLYRGTFVRSMAMVPVRPIRPLGALGVYWQDRHRASAEAVRWLQAVADAAALAVEHQQAVQETARARKDAQRLLAHNQVLARGQGKRAGSVQMCIITRRLEHQGRWMSLESYLKEQYGLTVYPGLSPEGLGRLQADDLGVATAAGSQGRHGSTGVKSDQTVETVVDLH